MDWNKIILLSICALCFASIFQNINRPHIQTGSTNGGVYLSAGSDAMPDRLKKRLYPTQHTAKQVHLARQGQQGQQGQRVQQISENMDPRANSRFTSTVYARSPRTVVPTTSVGQQPIPDCLKNVFTVRDSDRYLANAKTNKDFDVPTPMSSSKCFGAGQDTLCSAMAQNNPIDWTTEYSPGANNTYGDLRWHCQSPRTILIDNSMRCGEYDSGRDLNPPAGVAGVAGATETGTEFSAPNFTSTLWNELDSGVGIPKFGPGPDRHTMSPPNQCTTKSGLPPMRNHPQQCYM